MLFISRNNFLSVIKVCWIKKNPRSNSYLIPGYCLRIVPEVKYTVSNFETKSMVWTANRFDLKIMDDFLSILRLLRLLRTNWSMRVIMTDSSFAAGFTRCLTSTYKSFVKGGTIWTIKRRGARFRTPLCFVLLAFCLIWKIRKWYIFKKSQLLWDSESLAESCTSLKSNSGLASLDIFILEHIALGLRWIKICHYESFHCVTASKIINNKAVSKIEKKLRQKVDSIQLVCLWKRSYDIAIRKIMQNCLVHFVKYSSSYRHQFSLKSICSHKFILFFTRIAC